jgi:hypothetical protein
LKKDDKDLIDRLSSKLQAAVQKKETAKTNDEKLEAAAAIEEAKAEIKQVGKYIYCTSVVFTEFLNSCTVSSP